MGRKNDAGFPNQVYHLKMNLKNMGLQIPNKTTPKPMMILLGTTSEVHPLKVLKVPLEVLMVVAVAASHPVYGI